LPNAPAIANNLKTYRANTHMHIDYSVYPDLDTQPSLDTDEDKADYIQRICAAWDYGIMPDANTVELFSRWRDIFDRFPLETSASYAAFRAAFGWPPLRGSILQADYERFPGEAGRIDFCFDYV
jgi:hypothetical protein